MIFLIETYEKRSKIQTPQKMRAQIIKDVIPLVLPARDMCQRLSALRGTPRAPTRTCPAWGNRQLVGPFFPH